MKYNLKYLFVLISLFSIFTITMGGDEKTKNVELNLVERLSKIETKTDEPKLPEGMSLITENDIEITNIEQFKISVMEIFNLTELQFDVFSIMNGYDDKRRSDNMITDGKNFYYKRGGPNNFKTICTIKNPFIQSINNVKKYENPLYLLMSNQKKFNEYVADKLYKLSLSQA